MCGVASSVCVWCCVCCAVQGCQWITLCQQRSHCQLLSTADVVKVEQVRPQRHTSLASSLDGSQRLLEQDIATTAKLGTADFCLTSPSWIHKRSPPSTAQSSKGASHKTSRTPVCTAQQRSHFGHLAEKRALPHHFPQEQLP